MTSRTRWPALLAVVVLVLATACTAPSPSGTARPSGTAHPSGTQHLGPGPGPAPGPPAPYTDTSTPFTFTSLPALIRHRYDGRDLHVTATLAHGPAWTRYALAYRSGRLTLTGAMVVPTGPGPHPVVVIAHGYIDPAEYETGSMLEREQDYLAERGYVALQVDYRDHAGSSSGDDDPVLRPLGYPADLVDAVVALRRADWSFTDTSRIGLLGRSMGGGVVLDALAARPHLARAAVLYSPVSSLAADTYRRWVVPQPGLRERVERAFGTPRTRPQLWRDAGARDHLGRVAVPVQIHHGTADTVCPPAWSRATAAALRDHGADVELHEYDGENHRFDASWPLFMRRAVGFLDARLR
jgi:dipeptidyl aminopeptidase/acylaminoacyl peptidase